MILFIFERSAKVLNSGVENKRLNWRSLCVYFSFTIRSLLIKIIAMEDNNKANIVFNISGGNNQILPNATKAEQNFYGDKYIEEMMKAKTKSQESAISPESTRLSLYINNVEALAVYVAKLSACANAKELAQVVMDMVNDPGVKVDQYNMVKQEFIEVLQPLAPQVTTGIGNIRKYINEAWYKWK